VSVAVNNDDQGSDGEQGQPAVTLMDRIAECDDSSSDEDEGADRRQFIASKVANELEPYLLSKIIKKQDTAGGKKTRCSDTLGWWKVSAADKPVLSMMARDYLAIQGLF
jgi:hypothetical protein